MTLRFISIKAKKMKNKRKVKALRSNATKKSVHHLCI